MKVFKYISGFVFMFFLFLMLRNTLITLYGIQNGYKYTNQDDNVIYHEIIKDEKSVVPHTIVSIDNASNYIVGLRLPTKYLNCEKFSGLILNNRKEYFVLDTDTGKVIYFKSQNEFVNKLKAFKINNRVSLDYSRFDAVWKFYSFEYINIDFSKCRPSNSGMEYQSEATKLKEQNWTFPNKSEFNTSESRGSLSSGDTILNYL